MTSAVRRVVVDANVLFSRVLHELIGRAGNYTGTTGLYDVYWSEELLQETAGALVERYGMSSEHAHRAMQFVRDGFPQNHIDISGIDPASDLTLCTSDPEDEHVCALAILAQADILVSSDGGFDGPKLLEKHGVHLRHPDGFLVDLLADNEGFFVDLIEHWAAARRNTTPQDLLEKIAKAGCQQFAARLNEILADG